MKLFHYSLLTLLLCGSAMAQSGTRPGLRLAQADPSGPGAVEKLDAQTPGEQRRAALRSALKSQRTSSIKDDGTITERRMTPEELAELRLELRRQRHDNNRKSP
ncbi:MAG: hypothetical protein RIS34_1929 [Pseudomonadota bacterium]|jgi:hypothetical protein